MKKILAIMFAACLVFGFAGNAAASFGNGSIGAFAYGFDGNPNNVYNEYGIDLGVNGFAPAANTQETTISLGDFGGLGWDQVYVGAFSHNKNMSYGSEGFGDEDWFFAVNSGVVPSYSSANTGPAGSAMDQLAAVYNNDTSIDTGNSNSAAKKIGSTYNGMVPNSFAMTLDGIETSDIVLDLYRYNIGNWGGDAPVETLLGTVTFSLDAGDLVVSYDTAAVPVPAAAWLLGSGLLGLIGIRRRNA